MDNIAIGQGVQIYGKNADGELIPVVMDVAGRIITTSSTGWSAFRGTAAASTADPAYTELEFGFIAQGVTIINADTLSTLHLASEASFESYITLGPGDSFPIGASVESVFLRGDGATCAYEAVALGGA